MGKNLTYMSQLEGLDVRLYQARPQRLSFLAQFLKLLQRISLPDTPRALFDSLLASHPRSCHSMLHQSTNNQ